MGAALAWLAGLVLAVSTPPVDATPRVSVATTAVAESGGSLRVGLPEFAEIVDTELSTVLAAHFDVVSASGCPAHDRACERKHAADVEATLIVHTTVSADGVDHRVRFEVVDPATGDVEAIVGDECEVCGRGELEDLSRTVSGNLVRTLQSIAPEPAALELVGAPARATVRIDGEDVGQLPWKGTIVPGEHAVEVSRAGFVTERHEVTGVRGSSMRLSIDLERDRRRRARVVPIVGWSLVGAGAATAIGGGVLWGFDGSAYRRTCDDPDPRGECPQLVRSRPGGIALVSLGTAAAMVGGGLLIWQRVREGKTRSEVALVPQLDSMRVKWRF